MKKFFFLFLFFIFLFSLVFSLSEEDFKESVTYNEEEYYLYAYDYAELGEIQEAPGGIVPLAVLLSRAANLFKIDPAILGIDNDMIRLMKLEAKRTELIRRGALAVQIEPYYTEALQYATDPNPAIRRADTFDDAYKVLKDNLVRLHSSATSSYEKAALKNYLNNMGFDVRGRQIKTFSSAGQAVQDAFAGVGKGSSRFKILEKTIPVLQANSIDFYASIENMINPINSQMATAEARLTSKGFTVTRGTFQGLRIEQGGRLLFSAEDFIGSRLARSELAGFSGRIQNLDDVDALVKYVTWQSKTDLFLLKESAQIGRKLQIYEVERVANSKGTSRALNALKSKINAVNRFYRGKGLDISFNFNEASRSVEITKGNITKSFANSDDLYKMFNVGDDAIKLSIFQNAGLKIGLLIKSTKAGSASANFLSRVVSSKPAQFMKAGISKIGAAKIPLTGGRFTVGRTLGFVFGLPMQVGFGILRGGIIASCKYGLGSTFGDKDVAQNLFIGTNPIDTVYYLGGEDNVDPSLSLYSNFLFVDRCVEEMYRESYGWFGAGVLNFVDLSSFIQDVEEGSRKRLTGSRMKDCTVVIYSKEKPSEVRRLGEITGDPFSCVDSEDFGGPNLILADSIPSGEYISYQNIGVGYGAARYFSEDIFFEVNNDEIEFNTISDYRKKSDTYKMLDICVPQIDAYMNNGRPLFLKGAESDFDNLTKDELIIYESNVETLTECIEENGLYTETIEFFGFGGSTEVSSDGQRVVISFYYDGDSTLNAREYFSLEGLPDTSNIENEFELYDFSSPSPTKIDLPIIISGNKINIVSSEKGFFKDGQKIELQHPDLDNALKLTLEKRK